MKAPNDKFDFGSDEPSTLPPAPSRPADDHHTGARIRGVSADDWALGIERKLDAITKAQIDALQESAESNRAMANEVRQGFAKVLEVLKMQEQHGRDIRDLRSDVNGHARELAEHRAEIEKLKTAAKKRLKGKR